MGRSSTFPAVILRSREYGESNRLITLFSADQGILDALLYGGPKSKLKSLAAPYHSGRAWIYYDPVRDSRKLSDFDPESTYPGIRSRLRPSLHAALWAEILIRSRAGGSDFEHSFLLMVNCLKALDALPEDDAPYATFVFLWEYAGLLGLRPDPRACASCAGLIASDGVEYYSIHDGAFLCGDCRSDEDAQGAFIAVPPGVARYLERIALINGTEAMRLRLDEKGRLACQRLVFALARRIAEGELNALETGEGLL
jgi:DNA repair protein RecO (recombination protein O)